MYTRKTNKLEVEEMSKIDRLGDWLIELGKQKGCWCWFKHSQEHSTLCMELRNYFNIDAKKQ